MRLYFFLLLVCASFMLVSCGSTRTFHASGKAWGGFHPSAAAPAVAVHSAAAGGTCAAPAASPATAAAPVTGAGRAARAPQPLRQARPGFAAPLPVPAHRDLLRMPLPRKVLDGNPGKPRRKLSPLAAASLICALLAYIPYITTLSLYLSIPFAAAGIFLGVKGTQQIKEQYMRFFGQGIARAGFIISLVILSVVVFLFLVGLIL